MKVQTPGMLDQHWDLPVSPHQYLRHLRSCPASLLFGFCAMSVPLDPTQQVGISSHSERKLHAYGCVLCVAKEIVSVDPLIVCVPCLQSPKKKNVCAESLFYVTRLCIQHTCVITYRWESDKHQLCLHYKTLLCVYRLLQTEPPSG